MNHHLASLRFLPLLAALSIAACSASSSPGTGGTPRPDGGEPTVERDGGQPAPDGGRPRLDGGTDAGADPDGPVMPPEGWPASSVCTEPTFGCERVDAEGWPGSGLRYEWRWETTLQRDSVIVEIDGAGAEREVATFRSGGWHVPYGLAALSDGTLAASGAVGSGSGIEVSGEPFELATTYNRFVTRVELDGTARWLTHFRGISAERTVVAGRHDGTIAVAGVLHAPLEIGDFALEGPSWANDILVAALDADGEWLWATELPAGEALGDFSMESIELGPRAETLVHGDRRGTLEIAGMTYACEPLGSRCPSTAVIAADGTWVEIRDR